MLKLPNNNAGLGELRSLKYNTFEILILIQNKLIIICIDKRIKLRK